MGLCASADLREEKRQAADQRAQCRGVDKALHASQFVDQQINKLLLLGTDESGKSTLFKQLRTIYGKGFTESDRKDYEDIVYSNMLVSIKTLLEEARNYGDVLNVASKKIVLDTPANAPIDVVLGSHMKQLWQEKGVQAAYAHRSRFHLHESTAYYFARIDEIMQGGYIPTEQDVLRARQATTGVVEDMFEVDGNQILILDVGGQRSERKKWIHSFEHVTAVMFVSAIGSYDQVIYEDESVSRMTEDLALFEEIAHSSWFAKTAMILFLNKKDVFAEKLQMVPLSCYYPEYTGTTYAAAVEFMEGLFRARFPSGDKLLYVHVTCATDHTNMSAIFHAVKDIVIRRALGDAGLI